MRKIILSMVMTLFGTVLLCIAISATVTANIGVSSFDALTMTTSQFFNLPLGDASIVTNMALIFGQSVLTRFQMPFRQYFQVVSTLTSGFILNWLMDNIFQYIVPTEYWHRVVLFVFGFVTLMFAIALILTVNFMKSPFEGFCMEIANAMNKDIFAFVRQGLEFCIIAFAVYMTVFHGYAVAIREGTIIGILLGSHVIVFFVKRLKQNRLIQSILWE